MSIHEKQSVSSNNRLLLVVAKFVDTEVTRIFNFFPYKFHFNKNEKLQVLVALDSTRCFAKSSHWDVI